VSVHVLSWVLKNSPTTLADRLVLIVLADHADGDGGNAYPSVQTVADEAKVSPRTVQRSLRVLESEGHILKRGVTRKGATIWRVLTQIGDDKRQFDGATRDRMSPELQRLRVTNRRGSCRRP
jgi:pyocin large subunit-like protein